MPKNSTKTPPNAVRTSNRLYTYYLENLLFRGSSYFMTKIEMKLTLKCAFAGDGVNDRPVVYTAGGNKTNFAVETNGNTRSDYFAIGCMKFSRNSTIKIAKWCGLGNGFVNSYLQ